MKSKASNAIRTFYKNAFILISNCILSIFFGLYMNKSYLCAMIQIKDMIEIHPNALLITKNLTDDWSKQCDRQIINSVIDDLSSHGFEIATVDGYISAWDVTMYIDNDTSCDHELKLRALYTFSKCGNMILLDGVSIKDDTNLVAKLIQTNRISEALSQEFIDTSYEESKKQE